MLQSPCSRSQVLYKTPHSKAPTDWVFNSSPWHSCLSEWHARTLLRYFPHPANQMTNMGMFTAYCHLGSFIRALNSSTPTPKAGNKARRGWKALEPVNTRKQDVSLIWDLTQAPTELCLGNDTFRSGQVLTLRLLIHSAWEYLPCARLPSMVRNSTCTSLQMYLAKD